MTSSRPSKREWRRCRASKAVQTVIDLRSQRPPMPPGFPKAVKEAKEKILALADAQQEIKSADFKAIWMNYKKSFSDAQFGGKCAYCETRVRAGYPGEIEHFRPKSDVTTYGRRGNRDGDGPPKRKKTKTVRPGYWWLAYDWQNWLFSCNRCNHWKANQFPTQPETNKLRPGMERQLKPLLLNPMEDDPDGHFEYDRNGKIRGLTEQGGESVTVYALDRKYLVLERKRVAVRIACLADDLAVANQAGNELAFKQTVRRLVDESKPQNAYTGMIRFLISKLTGFDSEDWAKAIGIG